MKWIKHWAGKWSFLTSTYLGEQYTKLLKQTLGESLELSMFISKKGFTVCSLEKEDHHSFGTKIANMIAKDNSKAEEWSSELKRKTNNIFRLFDELEGKRIEKSDFFKIKELMLDYGSSHRAVKIAVDFLSQDLLNKYLPVLSDARVYAEPAYERTEELIRRLALQIGKEVGYDHELILVMTKDEFESYLEDGKLPDKSVLEERFMGAAISFKSGAYEVFTGKEVEDVEKRMENALLQNNIVKGRMAFPGVVKGRVKIVFNPREYTNFEQGDILVTGMTRPEYVHLIEKSGAFITDAGGMLSHAAIVARELRKPCVVGTEVATKIFKDGDLIEVDAENGIIRKL